MLRGGGLLMRSRSNFCALPVMHNPKTMAESGICGSRCAADANGPLEAIPNAETKGAPLEKINPNPPALPRSPDLSQYGKENIHLYPVLDRDPTRQRYQNTYSCCYMPSHITPNDTAKQPVPWKIEVRPPYFPDDRFAIFLENYWGRKMPATRVQCGLHKGYIRFLSSQFSNSHITLQGAKDYVDLIYDLQSTSQEEISNIVEMCFSTLAARPTFADRRWRPHLYAD